MKKVVMMVLCVTAMLSVSLSAPKDTISVVSDLTAGTEGNLNKAINNVITADPTGAKLTNTVFKLELNGYYILTSTVTTPPHATLTIVAPTPGIVQATAMPQIAWTTSGGVATTINFDCYGDLVMKNIWIMCATTSGTQTGSSIVMEDDSIANLNGKGEHLWMDNCIIDYKGIGNGGGAIEPSCRHFRAQITNTYFRNMTDSHYRYYGRAVSWTYQSTTWHTDTLTFENCTFSNCGYAYMQEAPEFGDHVSFNHCTFANIMMYAIESNYWWWLSVTNCLFVNTYMYGSTPNGDAGSTTGPGGYVYVDSVSTFKFAVPFTDSSTASADRQRHILVANNSYGHEKWYIDFITNNPYMPASTADRVCRMPALSGRTYQFFVGTKNGKKTFPYMNHINNIPAVDTAVFEWPPVYNVAADPKIILNPENIDSIKAFLLGRWKTGADVNWAFDINSDIQQLWPLAEDLSYTNATFKKAAMGGFPLGDLYHWWPTQYNAWLAQAQKERDNITNILTTGIITGVEEQTPALPLKYELSQNYPNPFNPTTNIDFVLPVKSEVRLVLMNVLGQEVKVITSGTYAAGNHSVTLNASSLASGVYFYKLQTEKFSDVKKLVLLK